MCREFWRYVQRTGQVAQSLWEWVSIPWQQCSAQRCLWWCLCCNKWVCWIALIILGIILIVFFILYVIWAITLLIICESLCILVAILQGLPYFDAETMSIKMGDIRVRCFQYSDPPSPPSSGTGTGSGGLNQPTDPSGGGIGTINYRQYPLAKRVTITRRDDLLEATRWRRLLLGGAPEQVELDGADDGRSRWLISTINHHLGACGCHEGRAGMLIAAGIYALLLWVEPEQFITLGWSFIIAAGIGFALSGALIGKITGILRAGFLVRKSARELINILRIE